MMLALGMADAPLFVMKTLACPIFGRVGFVVRSLRLLTILIMTVLASPVKGNIVWCGPVATGNGSGSDSNDLVSIASVNSSWPVAAGGQLNLCGTFTDMNQELNIGGSGTPGNPITIYFEPNAQFVAPYWPVTVNGLSGGAITVTSRNYITIDGGLNGLIQATQNGGSLSYQQQSCGVGASSASFLTVKNLKVTGMYQRTKSNDEAATGNTYAGIYNSANSAPPYAFTNFIVTNCVISDAYFGIGVDYDGRCDTFIVAGNTITRCNWGGVCADDGAGATITNLVLANNHISNFTNWNDPANDDFHHNGFYAWAESGGVLQNAMVYGNTIGPNFGGAYSTSGIFFSGHVNNMWLYNNVFVCNANDYPADALITIGTELGPPYGGVLVANNTFIGGGNVTAIQVSTYKTDYIFNNVGENCQFIDDNNGWGPDVIDYNFGYQLVSGQAYAFTVNEYTFSGWQKLGYDVHGSSTINPEVNSDGTLQAGTPIAMAGTNLSAYFTTDFAGNPRPATGPWTVGAYQVSSGVPLVSLAASPTNPIVSISNPANSNSPTLMLTWSSANASSVKLSGFGTVPLNGSTNASPSQSTNYTVTAAGANGTNSASVTVNVPAPPPALSASP
jgi:hypothetical protein